MPEPFQLIGQTPEEMDAENRAKAAREKAARQAAELEQRQAARLTGTLGEAGQKTMFDEPGTNAELFN